MRSLTLKPQTLFSQDKANNLYQQGLLLANNTVDKWDQSPFNDTAEFSIVIVGSLAANNPLPCLHGSSHACMARQTGFKPPCHSDAHICIRMNGVIDALRCTMVPKRPRRPSIACRWMALMHCKMRTSRHSTG